MTIEQNASYAYSNFTIKWATSKWEISQAHKLRRKVFCHEQGIFDTDDQDHIDGRAKCLVALANEGCWHDKVVGTVRIHSEGNNVWWGSRLAVDNDFRAQVGLGSALIKLAVSSANGLGCEQFLAQVQKQNEPLFKRLNWKSQYEMMIRKKLHVVMEAELAKFPPMVNPNNGFIIRDKLNSEHLQTPALPQNWSGSLCNSMCDSLMMPYAQHAH